MRQFGLIGRTLQHSFSQTYFSQKFYSQDLADHRYDLFELAAIGELPGLLRAHPDLVGLNVTVPYKESVVTYLDELAQSAARVGAVNVIECLPEGRLRGHNTDVTGFRESLRRFYPVAPGQRAQAHGHHFASKFVVEQLLGQLAAPQAAVNQLGLGGRAGEGGAAAGRQARGHGGLVGKRVVGPERKPRRGAHARDR